MAYFDALLQQAITVRNNRAPASNTADLVGGVLVAIVTALQMLLDDKQDSLTFDTTPTADSPNPVTSDGIYQALQAIDLSACEKIVNKVTSIDAQSTDIQYPSAKLLYDSLQALSQVYAAIQHTHAIADIINLQTELNARQLVSNLVTAITAQSTDVQYPSAKLLYDQLQGLAAVYAPKVHTHPFADIERPANVASVNAQGYTITTAYYSHVLTITADATLHLPTMQSGAAIILRLTIIQDATGGRAVTFDGGAALVFNPYQTDLSLGQANYRCWVVLWFDGVNWAWLASPYVLRAESQFAYTIDGTTGGQYVTITINGTTMQIQATSGVWQYGYNNPINSIAFTGDTGVLNVDFTNSDGLANITTLADAFKNCAALVAVDFTGCDLSNVATATDCFAGCTSLAALTIPTGTWKPDIDLSACAAFNKAAMLAVIDGLYTYASGTHTVTFNSTAWDALSQADQQQVYNAADAKGWTTNAVAVTYVIRGTSSNVNGTETFNIQFIQDGAQTPDAAETITVNVDANGDWSFEYSGKKIYSLRSFCNSTTTIISLNFTESDGLNSLVDGYRAFYNNSALTTLNFGNATFQNLQNAQSMFNSNDLITSLNLHYATFANVTDASYMFSHFSSGQLTSLDLHSATFGLCTNFTNFLDGNTHLTTLDITSLTCASAQICSQMFNGCTALTALDLHLATFANVTNGTNMFKACTSLVSLDLSIATFASVTTLTNWLQGNTALTTIDLSTATFASLTAANNMFSGLSALSSIDLSSATFAVCTTIGGMFDGCLNITSIDISTATFANVTNTRRFVFNCKKLATIDLSAATFANVTDAYGMFNQYSNHPMQTLSMPEATFAKVTNAFGMFLSDGLVTLNIPKATMGSVTDTSYMFADLKNLTTINVPQGTFPKTFGFSRSNSGIALTYQSMVNVANWCKDLTGGTAQSVTFNTTAWNALTAAEQTTIDNILSGKNWTRVLAN